MNVMRYGRETGGHDWVPDRAIGPTDDRLYEAEQGYHDEELGRILDKPLAEVQAMPTGEKRDVLMRHRKEELRKLIQVYYGERGWSASGIPTVATLQQLGLWSFLSEGTRTELAAMAC
jgi:aldehyde:ferredoxin oxidoreductase